MQQFGHPAYHSVLLCKISMFRIDIFNIYSIDCLNLFCCLLHVTYAHARATFRKDYHINEIGMDVVAISTDENAVRDCNANPADPQGSLTVTLKKLFGNPSRQKPPLRQSLSAKSKWTLPASHSSLHGPTPEAMVVQKKKRRASVFFPMVCFNLTVPSARYRELG